jgi:hypothetical protein
MPNNPNQLTFLPLKDLPLEKDFPRVEAKPIPCPCCKKEFDSDEGIEHEGENHCPQCVCECEGCEETHMRDDMHDAYISGYRRNTTSPRCEECCWKCADCGLRFVDDADSSQNACDERICERCSASYTMCESCDDTIHCDDSYGHDGRTLCRSCYDYDVVNEPGDEPVNPVSRRHSGLVHEYDYKPSPMFHRAEGETLDFSRPCFGFELEVDNGPTDHDEHIKAAGLVPETGCDTFYCKHDGSLTTGFEIVSHPGTWSYWASHELAFCDVLKAAGYKSYDTSTCGMHVHVSRSALSKLDIFKLLEFAKHNPHFMYRVSRRKSESHMNEWASVDEAQRGTLAKKAKGDEDVSLEKYEAINLVPSRTIEFRIFRGTLDKAALRRNLSFVAALVAYVKECGIHELELTSVRFVRWIDARGRVILGKGHAKILYNWVNSLLATRGPEWVDEDSDQETRLCA